VEHEPAAQRPEQETVPDVGGLDVAASDGTAQEHTEDRPAGLSPAELFERLAHIRDGISGGVITPW
jgi:hypothetical protein